jgi:hypothetical protein
MALNELSLQHYSTKPSELLLRELARAICAVRDLVGVVDATAITFYVPDDLYSRRIGADTVSTVARALQKKSQQDDDLEAGLVLQLLAGASFPTFEPPFEFAGSKAAGLSYARSEGGLSVSLDAGSPWNQEQLAINDTAVGTEVIQVNYSCPPPSDTHRQVVSSKCTILPDYTDPGTHRPGSSNYVNGKSHIPDSARAMLTYAVRGEDDCWWARCQHGFFHRYGGGATVHWNGNTNPNASQTTAPQVVPIAARRLLEKRPAFENCGCRQLTDR